EVLQQRRSSGLEVERSVLGDGRFGSDLQLVQTRDGLDDAGRMGDAQRAHGAGAVIAVVQQDPIVGAYHVEEVRAEADHQTDDARGRAERVVVADLLGAQQYGLVKTKVRRVGT